jgi:hypothetical protein
LILDPERGVLIMNAITSLNTDSPGAAGACGWWAVSHGKHETLPPAVAEELALLYREAAVPRKVMWVSSTFLPAAALFQAFVEHLPMSAMLPRCTLTLLVFCTIGFLYI